MMLAEQEGQPMIKVADFTPEKAEQVLELYQRLVGGAVRQYTGQQMLEDLKRDGQVNARLGSHWSIHSKFIVEQDGEHVTFRCNTNLDATDRCRAEAEAVAEQFRRAANVLI